MLTILGIILFLRLGYVTGSAGLARALVMIALANMISVLTTVSLSAIATNLRVKGGGDYYLISRTLGLEFGGAIGIVLYLAQSVSIAFYCIGFGEALVDILPVYPLLTPRLIAASAVGFLFFFAWMGADVATKFQYVVMTLLVAAIVSFFAGGLPLFDTGVMAENWTAPSNGPGFWVLFAIFFPAVTGFTQGVSMSGDLKDPGKSLPTGTFLAVGVSIVVYFGTALVFAGAMPNAALAGDYTAMKRIARFGFLIDAGVVAATLSSAMASFLGAPRILQSLAADRIFSFLLPFAKGEGAANNPRRGVLLSGGIALVTIGLGNLNLIAPVVSMFFLISYGLLNYATWFEARAESPSFRPKFKWFDKRLSLAGFIACLGVMLAIDLATGIVAISILFAIYQYLKRTAGPARWADSRRAYYLQRVRENMLSAASTPGHPRDWRPQILAFSNDPSRRARLLTLAGWMEGRSGMTTIVRMLQASGLKAEVKSKPIEEELRRDIQSYHPNAFPLVLAAENMEEGISGLLQTYGIGPLKANTILLNWLNPNSKVGEGFKEFLFGRQLRSIYRHGCNIAILYTDEQKWAKTIEETDESRRIDIIWTEGAGISLMLLLAYLMTRSDAWRHAEIRLTVFCEAERARDYEKKMTDVLEESRIDAHMHIVGSQETETIEEELASSDLVIIPFRLRGNLITGPVEGRMEELLTRLPTSLLILAAEDIDLDAEPEEGIAAEKAAASDTAADLEKKAAEMEKEAEAAQQAVEEIRERLGENQEPASDTGDGEASDLQDSGLAAAEEKAEKARRRAAKARAKAEAAAKAAEEPSAM